MIELKKRSGALLAGGRATGRSLTTMGSRCTEDRKEE